jgi:hypothetical protein
MNRPADALTRRGLVTASAGAGALAATSHLLPSFRAGSPGPQPEPPATRSSGSVGDEWAREHHAYWYDDIEAGRIPALRSGRPGSQAPVTARAARGA